MLLQVMLLCIFATMYYLFMHDTRAGAEEAEEAIIADEVDLSDALYVRQSKPGTIELSHYC